MDYPIHIDAISMEMSILYFMGLPVKILNKLNNVFLSPKIVYILVILANNADPDEMLHFIWVFTVCQST